MISLRRLILKRMSAKDFEETFRKAYEEHMDAIFRHCYFRVFDRERALELTQDTFMKTWKYLSEKGKIDNIRAFLYKTATNLVIDHARKQKLRKHDSLESLKEIGFEPVNKSAGADIETDARLVVAAIDKLKSIYRDVMYLKYVGGFGPKEISQRLGLSENAVSVRLHRGLKQLKKRYEK